MTRLIASTSTTGNTPTNVMVEVLEAVVDAVESLFAEPATTRDFVKGPTEPSFRAATNASVVAAVSAGSIVAVPSTARFAQLGMTRSMLPTGTFSFFAHSLRRSAF